LFRRLGPDDGSSIPVALRQLGPDDGNSILGRYIISLLAFVEENIGTFTVRYNKISEIAEYFTS